jgi:hypothetical protein
MIGKYLQAASNHSSSSVKVVACDCFASMSKWVFESLHVGFMDTRGGKKENVLK